MGTEETHDVYEGEIPANIGKKNNGLIKIVGLLALIGVLGAAAYVLNFEENKQSVMESTKGTVQDFMTSNMPNGVEAEETKSTPTQKVNIGNEEQSRAFGSDAIEINLAEQESPINHLPLRETMPQSNMSSQYPTNAVNMDTAHYPEEADPIIITAPEQPTPTENVNGEYASLSELSALRDKVIEIQSSDQERINVIQSGIEMQSTSIDKLNNLLESLDGLKKELAELNKKASSQPVHKTRTQAEEKVNQSSAKPSPNAKPVAKAFKPDLILLGIDRWGDEQFAQIQHGDQIHLLAKHEKLNGWRVTSISKGAIIVVNDNGESFEIKN